MPASVILYRPQIPPNTGNIARQCVGWNTPLRILKKPGFDLSSTRVKRAGLDHWSHLDFEAYFDRLYEMVQYLKGAPCIAITKEGTETLWDYSFPETCALLFGSETNGLPPKLRKLCQAEVRIPIFGEVRSFNLANSVSIVLAEYLRQNQPQDEIRRTVNSYKDITR